MAFFMSKDCMLAFESYGGPSGFSFRRYSRRMVRIRTVVTGELCAARQELY